MPPNVPDHSPASAAPAVTPVLPAKAPASGSPTSTLLAPVLPQQSMPVLVRIASEARGQTDRGAGLAITEPCEDSRTPEERAAAIEKVFADYQTHLVDRTEHHLGYPYNLDFDYGPLEGLLKYSINNLGDPFIESNYGVHSRQFEVGVLEWFAKLWEIEGVEDYWGYITNCGTEGNLEGILIGREVLPDGILYASKESHYSVMKAARMYRMDAEEVGTLPTGEIDYDALEERLVANVGRPAILNINIGTTVKGAVDDVDRIIAILGRAGYSEDRFYIHCDGALFGLMLPFVREDAPMVTFRKPIGSVSVSGHKFVGCPTPCGIVITRMRHCEVMASNIEYLASRDATIMGSRNGHAPLYLWYTLMRKGNEGMRADVEKCMRNAQFLKKLLQKEGVKCLLNELSSTVVFERPVDIQFVRKWQLACEREMAHVVVMPNVGPEKLELFVKEMMASRAQHNQVSPAHHPQLDF